MTVSHRHRLSLSLFALVLATVPWLSACANATATDTVNASADRPTTSATSATQSAGHVETHYQKHEYRIPMRDGIELHTAVYTPRDNSHSYPFLMRRTPYSCRPYGEDQYPDNIGPNPELMKSGYIFVIQDVRGCYMSEGEFVNMRPHIDNKQASNDIDESSDTYDTIDWLVKHIPNNNNRVGMWGISYPGFYCAAGMIDAHPALRAVSPQAPISDWWQGDDFHHNGAFFLAPAFGFMAGFGHKREGLTKSHWQPFDFPTPDGYEFFLDLGSLANANPKYFHNEIPFWNDMAAHPDDDAFWQARDILPHLKNVAPAVMTVGGWFDAEDLYGPLHIYESVEQKNPNVFNVLVMGPWFHGGWARSDGDHLGNIRFGAKTSLYYRQNLETPFFEHFLKDKGSFKPAEATIFETGANRWQTFGEWPPKAAIRSAIYFRGNGQLRCGDPHETDDNVAFDEFVSDPSRPVPYTEEIVTGMTREYMTDDQRFAARRPDVLVYQTKPLTAKLTLAGPMTADLWVSTSQTDADWVVKLIDVLPPDTPTDDAGIRDPLPRRRALGGYQMLVRGEIFRGRYRNDRAHPEPFVPGQPTRVRIPILDVLHTFQPGHRVMVQIQSTWFPLADRNPQKFVPNIFEAGDADFVPATHRVYRSVTHPSRLEIGVLND